MYLAGKKVRGTTRFSIKESFKTDDGYEARHLFDLGESPENFIIYPGGNAFYIDDVIEEALKNKGVDVGDKHFYSKLEDIFWPFLDPRIRRALNHFKRREDVSAKNHESHASHNDGVGISAENVHVFDKRRVQFLRFGRKNHGRIGLMPDVLFKWMKYKSRDEIEYDFIEMESRLKFFELKTYTYVIFDIQRFFTETIAKNAPENLNQDKVDDFFLSEICRINKDLFTGDHSGLMLHDHLIRYMIMFFDYDYLKTSPFDDIAREFMNRHRDFRFPGKRIPMSVGKAAGVFGVTEDVLKNMTKRDLTRLYRQKARETHPDMGGDHNQFIALTDAFKNMAKRLK